MENKPLVSICCITFNHGKFIKNCLEGFVTQKTIFDFEILVFDDASVDETQQIILEYSRKHNNIVTFLQTENQWSKKKYGILDWLFPAAKGKYIALCEGDDYWTDPLKLQKQVDFLEANPWYVQVFHNALAIYNDQSSESFLYCKALQKEDLETKDLLKYGNIIPTCSSVFHRNILKELPKWMSQLSMGDFPINLLLSLQGKVRYFNEVMSVYRIHSGGSWSAATPYNNDLKLLAAYKAFLKNLRFSKEEKSICLETMSSISNRIFDYLISQNEKKQAVAFLLKRLSFTPSYLLNIRLLKNIKHLLISKKS